MPTTREAVIEVDQGAFTGKINEVIEYLGFGDKSQICKCALKNGVFRGRHLKLVGYIKHKMIYGVVSEGILIRSGTADELAEFYHVTPCVFSNHSRTGSRLLGEYEIIKVQMTEILEPVTRWRK